MSYKIIIMLNKFLKVNSIFPNIGKRFILLPAYQCEELWKQKSKIPFLAETNAYEFASKIKEKHQHEGIISAIDIDILACKLPEIDPNHLDFIEDLFYKFRHTKEALKVTDSTHNSLMRTLLNFKEYDRLIKILQNKIHFGIFLDHYTANILLDHFLENKLYDYGVQIVNDLMLQEDFNNPITKILSLYTCHLYLQNISSYVQRDEKVEETEEVEIKYRKVSYIEEPWYDDHFDIPTITMKLGKSLTMLTSNSMEPIDMGFHLLGLGLYQKFDKALDFLKMKIIENSGKKNLLPLSLFQNFESILSDIQTKEPPPPIEPGLLRLVHLYPHITGTQKESFIQTLKELKDKLTSQDQFLKDIVITDLLKQRLQRTLIDHQSIDIETQSKTYKNWKETREKLIIGQFDEINRLKKKEEISTKLLELKATEEKFRYFEEKSKIDLILSKVPIPPKIKDVVVEEQFVAPPGERKSSESLKKKSR